MTKIDETVARLMHCIDGYAQSAHYDGKYSMVRSAATQMCAESVEAALRTELIGHAVQAEPVAEVIAYKENEHTATIRYKPLLNGICPLKINQPVYTTPQPATTQPEQPIGGEVTDAAASAAMFEGNKHGVKSFVAAKIVAAYLAATIAKPARKPLNEQ